MRTFVVFNHDVLQLANHLILETSSSQSIDRILMMESGSLVESGTHSQLLELQGRYAALYSQQEADLD